ncbi:MAG: peptide transporter [Myxococcales bacterium]|nr:peptide transporter [Myxococcales bacterium]
MSAATAIAKPRELTVRAVVVAVLVAALIGSSYPYVVLKIGFGPNISVVSAFFGYILLTLVGLAFSTRATRQEMNLVQTAGTAAGQAGFMCVVLAAFDMLRQKPELGFNVQLTTFQIFAWLSLAGVIGVLLAVPLRKHYIDEENLPFPDGTAAGETLLVLDQGPAQAGPRVAALGLGMGASGLLAVIRDGLHALPEALHFGASGQALRMGTEVSLLSFGSGMLVGLRIALSMGLGMLLSWVISPPLLVEQGIIAAPIFKDVLRWVMWPATGLLVAGGLTALLLKWRVVARTFTHFSAGDVDSTDMPLSVVFAGVVVATVGLCVLQSYSLGFPVWLTLISLVVSFVLMLVGTRVLGETNWAPVSALANFTQALFALLSPGNIAVNMIGSGMSGTIAANGEHLMQDFKAGKIVGSSNRNLTILQLIGVPVGALSVALVYPVLAAKYGIGENGLSSPISVKWAGFGELVSKGFDALPAGCFAALGVAVVLGIALTVLEGRFAKFVPSPTGVGIGMLVPGLAVMPMLLGGIAQFIWLKTRPETEGKFNLPLASGFVAGEALVVLVLALGAMFGV